MEKKVTDEKLIALLKGLPREKAPENFEFNLMTRIKNGNFGDLEKEERGNWLWIFLPSATIVTATVVVLMFMFSAVEDSTFVTQTAPPKIEKNVAKTYVVVKDVPEKSAKELEAVKIVKAPNDVVTKERIKIPVNNAAGVSVDRYLNKSLGGGNSAATLVSSEEKLPFEFHGFLPYTQVPARKEHAKRDSVGEPLRK